MLPGRDLFRSERKLICTPPPPPPIFRTQLPHGLMLGAMRRGKRNSMWLEGASLEVSGSSGAS